MSIGAHIQHWLFSQLKPQSMLAKARSLQKPSGIACSLSFLIALSALYWLRLSDETQGQIANIMFVHVPTSWGALTIYTTMAVFSLLGLILRVPQAFLMSKALAPVGLLFCTLSLVTGSLWGKPTWGTFWVWDARLTSMFILLLLYVGYIITTQTHTLRQLIPAAYLNIIGLINIPIIKGSVEWWYTLHQPATIDILKKKAAMDVHFFLPLLLMTFAFVCYTVYVTALRLQSLIQSAHHKESNEKCTL